jgi:hypothetical protein
MRANDGSERFAVSTSLRPAHVGRRSYLYLEVFLQNTVPSVVIRRHRVPFPNKRKTNNRSTIEAIRVNKKQLFGETNQKCAI